MERLRIAGDLSLGLTAGLLLQIVVQIKLLKWLPDFPAYDALALTAAAFALIASPFASIAIAKGRLRLVRLVGVLFFVGLTLLHAGLAAKSASLAVQQWRDIVLWPALVSGLAVYLPVTLSQRSIAWQGTILWMLGEAFVAIFAAWYAPSFGEATNFATYRYVLYQMLITTAVVGAAWLATSVTESTRAPLARFALISGATCVVAATFMLFPWPIGNVLLVLLLLRFLITLLLVHRQLQETTTGKDISLPA